MDLFEALATRRSVRKFTDEPVGDEDLRLRLRHAPWRRPAPGMSSPGNLWRPREAPLRERLSKASPCTGMAAQEPVVIVASGDLREETAPGHWPQDCSAATQNPLLAARGLNLGSVWRASTQIPSGRAI